MNCMFGRRSYDWLKRTKKCSNVTQRLFASSFQLSHDTNASSLTSMTNNSLADDNSFSSLISSHEIRERHQSLMNTIDKSLYLKRKPCLLLIAGSSRLFQADTKIPTINFKQNSDFIYLTGFNCDQSADNVLALIGGNGSPVKSVLFAPKVDTSRELWEGPDIREHSLRINTTFDDVRDITELDAFIKLQHNCRQVLVSKSGLSNGYANGLPYNKLNNGANDVGLGQLSAHLKRVENLDSKSVIHQLSPFIEQLRVIKSKAECDAMRRTCRLGSQAMRNTMHWTKAMLEDNNKYYKDINLINESQIAAKFEYEARIRGARKIAFPTVCGAGNNSTIIHYGGNNKFALPNDWVLTDAGCEDIDGYNSDITRTWPIDGQYSNSHLRRELYEALCDVQNELIKAISQSCQSQDMSLDDLFRLMCHFLGKLLIEFKVIGTSISQQEAEVLAYKFCPHHISHYLGLDIHDCPTVSRSIPVKAGICFTIEPGLYFHDSYVIKPEFKGIGMRVEDDFIFNSDGQLESLTKDCPHFLNMS